jgi:hypothetical protein
VPEQLQQVGIDWRLYSDNSGSGRSAQAIATAVHTDVAGAATTPVLLLGDLGASSLAGTFTDAGLTDSFRVANPDATAVPGVTWPLFPTAGATADRIDYVDFSGNLHVQASQTLTVGFPSGTSPAGNSWASEHAAVVTLFTVGDGSTTTAPTAPTVSVIKDTVAYQVGHGPANGAALLTDIGAGADPAEATLAVDLSDVDFGTAGWYTAVVTARDAGITSDPVAITVRVAPVPNLALGATTASFAVGTTIDEAGVLAQLLPSIDVPGAVRVDLSPVNAALPGSYPVTVTATDEWGFAVTQAATVTVTGTLANGVVAGTVTDAQGGKQLANICVYLYQHGVSAWATYATCTDATGAWSLGGLAPGSYDVAFADPAAVYTTQWSNGTTGGAAGQAGAQPITVKGGNATVAGINAAMVAVPTGIASGTVTAKLDGEPLADICVYLYPHGASTAAAYATCTAADGTFSRPGVATGSYDVAFFDPTGVYATVWHGATATGSPTQAGSQAVSVPTGNKSVDMSAVLSPVAQ